MRCTVSFGQTMRRFRFFRVVFRLFGQQPCQNLNTSVEVLILVGGEKGMYMMVFYVSPGATFVVRQLSLNLLVVISWKDNIFGSFERLVIHSTTRRSCAKQKQR